MPRTVLAAALSACAGNAACGAAGGGEPAVRTDSAGVEIVVNPGADRPLDWRFERVRALGGAEAGPESFYRVRAGLVAADGRGGLYVLDRENKRLVAFDSVGAVRWTAGREGGGPGEFLSPNTVTAGGDGVVAVHDLRKAALVRFDADGEVLPQVPFEVGTIRVGFPHVHVVPDGIAYWDRARYEGSDERPVRLVRAAGAAADTLFSAVLPLARTAAYPSCGMTLTLPTLFAPRIRWDRAGGRIVAVSGADYAIEIYEGGRRTMSVRRSIEPVPIDRSDALAALGESGGVGGPIAMCGASPAERLDKHGFAPELQLIQALAVAPDGWIWVRRSAGIRRPDEPGASAIVAGPIDLFDATGEYRGSLPPDTPMPVVFLPGDRVGYAERDETDVERLVVARIVRS